MDGLGRVLAVPVAPLASGAMAAGTPCCSSRRGAAAAEAMGQVGVVGVTDQEGVMGSDGAGSSRDTGTCKGIYQFSITLP